MLLQETHARTGRRFRHVRLKMVRALNHKKIRNFSRNRKPNIQFRKQEIQFRIEGVENPSSERYTTSNLEEVAKNNTISTLQCLTIREIYFFRNLELSTFTFDIFSFSISSDAKSVRCVPECLIMRGEMSHPLAVARKRSTHAYVCYVRSAYTLITSVVTYVNVPSLRSCNSYLYPGNYFKIEYLTFLFVDQECTIFLLT